MTVTVKVVMDKTKKIAEGLRVASSHRVMAGVPASKGLRRGDEEVGPINNAALMYIHEHGAPEANIPARPVIRPAIKSIQKQVVRMLRGVALDALGGRPGAVMQGLNAIGILAQNAMRRVITTGPFVPLSERTLAARRARGRTGTKPLIDTGQLRRALTYVVRKII